MPVFYLGCFSSFWNRREEGLSTATPWYVRGVEPKKIPSPHIITQQIYRKDTEYTTEIMFHNLTKEIVSSSNETEVARSPSKEQITSELESNGDESLMDNIDGTAIRQRRTGVFEIEMLNEPKIKEVMKNKDLDDSRLIPPTSSGYCSANSGGSDEEFDKGTSWLQQNLVRRCMSLDSAIPSDDDSTVLNSNWGEKREDIEDELPYQYPVFSPYSPRRSIDQQMVPSKTLIEAQCVPLPFDRKFSDCTSLGSDILSVSRRQSCVTDDGEEVPRYRYLRTPSVVVSDYSDDPVALNLDDFEYIRGKHQNENSSPESSLHSSLSNFFGNRLEAYRKNSDCSSCSTFSGDDDSDVSCQTQEVLLVCISQGNTICLQNTSDINCQGNFLENFSQEKYIKIPESNSLSLRSKSLISEEANSETSTSTTSTPSPTTNFTCKHQGRFANETDTTCRTYIFCYLLPNMTYIQQNLTCPQGTKFNKALRTCSRNYLCQIPTRTTESITSTTVSTTVTSDSETTTIAPKFNCTDQGRFANESDATCRTYIFCYLLPNKTYIQQNLTCPQGTRFNKALRTCSRNYLCEITTTATKNVSLTTTTTSDSETTTDVTPCTPASQPSPENLKKEPFTCKKNGRFSNENDINCKSYYLCISQNNSFRQYFLSCPDNQVFNPITRSCSSNYTCSNQIENFSSTTISSSNCELTGRFLNPEDTTCTSYLVCILYNNLIISKKYACANGTFFDLKQCSTNYQCPRSITENPNVDINTGRYLNDEDVNCSSYLIYVSDGKEVVIKKYRCKTNTFFNPVGKECLSNYVCKKSETPITNRTGRISDKTNMDCSSYTVVISDGNNLISKTFRCKDGTYFDPRNQICTEDYQCNKLTTQIPKPNSTGKYINGEDISCSTYTMIISNGDYLIPKVYRCRDGTYFDPLEKLCTRNYQCPGVTITFKFIKTTPSTGLKVVTKLTKATELLIPAGLTKYTESTKFTESSERTKHTEFIKVSNSTNNKKSTELTKPTQATEQTKLTDPTGSTEHTKRTESTELTKSIDSTGSTEHTKHTEHTELTNSKDSTGSTEQNKQTESTDLTKSADSIGSTEQNKRTEPTELAKSTDPTGSTKHANLTEPTELTKLTGSTEQNKRTESTEPTKSADSTGSTEQNKRTEPTELAKSTDPTESTEHTKRTESIELTKSTDSTGSTEQNKRTEPTELTKSTDSTGSIEHTKRTESTELTKLTDSTGSTEPTILTESSELTKVTDPVESIKPTKPSELTKSADFTVSKEYAGSTERIQKCTNRGKYAYKENCTSYLLCVSTHDSFVSRTYSCPEKSFFDPVNQICSIGYKCNNVSTS